MSAISSIKPGDADMLTAPKNPTHGISLRGKNGKPDMAKIDAVAKDFEAQFLSQMLAHMFETVDAKEALGGNDSEEVYQSMMVDQYGKQIARAGGIGVADHIKRQLLQYQEVKERDV